MTTTTTTTSNSSALKFESSSPDILLAKKRLSSICSKLELASKNSSSKLTIDTDSIRKKFAFFDADWVWDPSAIWDLKPSSLASFIDHTALKPVSSLYDIQKLVIDANNHHFASVCVNGSRAIDILETLETKPNVPIACVIGFPLGAASTQSKVSEVSELARIGIDEFDMVCNIGYLKDGRYFDFFLDIHSVAKAISDSSQSTTFTLKVILETCFLTKEEIIDASILSIAAGATFIKTSTGFGTAGAKPEHVKLMRRIAGPTGVTGIGVKASGGIRDTQTALQMIYSGANRIGASSGLKIIGIS